MSKPFKPKICAMKITQNEPGKTAYYFKKLFCERNSPNLIGYSENSKDHKQKTEDSYKRIFFHEININDIIIVVEGQKRVHGCVVVESEPFKDPNKVDSDPDWFINRRKAKLVKHFDPPISVNNQTNKNAIIENIKFENQIWNEIKNDYYEYINLKPMKNYFSLLENENQLILQGPPGTGKTRKAKQIATYSITGEIMESEEDIKDKVQKNSDRIKLIQFHPAYNYDDFVRGLVPKPTDNGLSFEPENKVLLDMAGKAVDNPKKDYFLIIDEINRANLPEVLGELIYALEYRGSEVDGLYPAPENDPFKKKLEATEKAGSNEKELRKIWLPSNLYIIGTMNTADRSVGTLDYAIRRRFVFEHLSPDPENVLDHNGEGYNLYEKVEAIFGEIQENNSDNNNKRVLKQNNHLSPEFEFNDVMIGHSYFMVNDKDENGHDVSDDEKKQQLQNNLEYKIKPILREYAKDEILIDNGGDVMTEIENL